MVDYLGSTKSQRTRRHILEVAQRDASLMGIDSLTIGGLAQSCGLSKSGLNAHFGSKESLQVAVIDATAMRFRTDVGEQAFAKPPGHARLIAIMEYWIGWSQHPARPGGCQLIAATFDFDGLEGIVRDTLQNWIEQWRAAIKAAVVEANVVESLNLDPDRTASLAFGLYMAQHMERLLLEDGTAAKRARNTWVAALEA
ncbi:MAG: TetR/AcrR family transcriptional regulator [Epibacterium sp.]|jgi:AcrR family transcriptional regulator|nr:TetR/AcrR family transcriptional regulator [Epibacterium sp.]NQX75119.1 TetR/AcrR family transcriptional regulator [Epibacterium sp.]